MDKNAILEEIKRKKELSGLADSLVSNILDNYLRRHNIEFNALKKKEIKIVIKDIRAELRNLAGRFQKSLKKIELKNENINEILKTHASTSERFDFYPKLRAMIRSLKISSILDIGCGLNPIALADKKIYYYASDVNEENLALIRKFFEKHKIKGEVFTYDIKNPNTSLPKSDLCLMLKLLDIVETKSHEIAKAIIEKIDYKYILISFATKTLSGKRMRYPRRKWFEFLLKNLNCEYKTFSSNNELFYLVKKLS